MRPSTKNGLVKDTRLPVRRARKSRGESCPRDLHQAAAWSETQDFRCEGPASSVPVVGLVLQHDWKFHAQDTEDVAEEGITKIDRRAETRRERRRNKRCERPHTTVSSPGPLPISGNHAILVRSMRVQVLRLSVAHSSIVEKKSTTR